MSLDWIDAELALLESAHLLRRRVTRRGAQSASISVDGQSYVNFGSNDYLGIAADPQLDEIVQRTMHDHGWGSGASPLILGRGQVHEVLEQQLAEFLGCEAALLFPSGFAANTGTIPAIVDKRDVIFSDAKNHASIIDGCRLSGAKIEVYPHNNLDALNAKMQSANRFRRRLIVSDGLFSMDGDLACVERLVELAEHHEAMLMVDEAHALGVCGDHGRGVCVAHGVASQVDIRVGTLSKSFGSHGGFVAGSSQLIHYLANCARSYVFSTAAPEAVAAVALAALRIMREQPHRRQHLLRLATHARAGLIEQGWRVPHDGLHIIPVVIGDAADTMKLAEQLKRKRCWVPCIRPPSVPPGESLLRISLSSAHSDQMISDLLAAFATHNPIRLG